MANIKVGDIVVAGWGSYCTVKRVTRINPSTIAVESLGGGCCEPRQHPATWRVAVPEILERVKALFEKSERIRDEANALLRTMPGVKL